MKLSQKRNCNNCRALEASQSSSYCSLHFNMEVTKRWKGIGVGFKPTEPCYKPLTIQNLIDSKELIKG